MASEWMISEDSVRFRNMEAFQNRAREYMRDGEECAMYLHGLADGIEQAGGSKDLVHHLREHAEKLNMGTLYVRHDYKTE